MNRETHTFSYGKKIISYSVIHTKRKTLEIAVHPDSSVIVTAPLNCELNKINEKIKKRAKWISKQLKFYKQFEPYTLQKQYLNGESHLYLGRNYRVKIITGLSEYVKLTHGFFVISVRDKNNKIRIKELINKWYNEKAVTKFEEYFSLCWKRFDEPNKVKPILRIRKMNKRWGSLSPKGTLTLNLELIKAPKECIEYVITHELCHTLHHNHSSEFYRLLEEVMPGWKKLKHKLELKLS